MDEDEEAKLKRVYWSAAPTCRPNLAHCVPLLKITELLRANCEVIIFLADLHAYFDGTEAPWHLFTARTDCYQSVFESLLVSLGAPTDKLKFVRASELELTKDYMLDLYLLAGSTQISKASEACQDILKPTKHPPLGGLLYPIVRAVDEKHVGTDGQLLSKKECDFIRFVEELSSKINHKPGARLFYAPLAGGKYEDSDFVDLFDYGKQLISKLKKAFCEPGNVENNAILPIVKDIIFPIYRVFDFERPQEYGGDAKYSTYEEVEHDYKELKVHPEDLKKGVRSKINQLFTSLTQDGKKESQFQELASTGFPTKKDKRSPKVVPIRSLPSINNLTLGTNESTMTKDDKLQLITRRLQEVLRKEQIESILDERNLRIYWGTATTGRPHLAYFVPMAKIADFLLAECEVTILLADLHGYLDSQKAPWNLLDARTKYYQHVIIAMLKSINVPIDKLKFVRGTEFELSSDFSHDLFRLITKTTLHDAKKAGAEVVKQMSDPIIGSLIYPLLQALDEEYLDCDAQFGGVDQRKIFTYAEKHLPQIGYSRRAHLMNPMVPGLTGDKMSSSVIESKIDLLDGPEAVKAKIDRAACPRDNIADNGVLAFIEHVIWPLFGKLTLESQEGKEYEQHEKLVEDFVSGALNESDLKSLTVKYINKLLDPIRKEFESDELRALTKIAYP